MTSLKDALSLIQSCLVECHESFAKAKHRNELTLEAIHSELQQLSTGRVDDNVRNLFKNHIKKA